MESKRLRPFNALNLDEMFKDLKHSTIKTIKIDDNPWSIIATVSPYIVGISMLC